MQLARRRNGGTDRRWMVGLALLALSTAAAGRGQNPGQRSEEVVLQSGTFRLVGDLRLPAGPGPHPVVVFVHGDGSVYREGTDNPSLRGTGVGYAPIMERMLRAGYATLSWDKPGTGASTGRFEERRLHEQRARIVVDAIEFLKTRPDIDPRRIGLWGFSQGGYVMSWALGMRRDISFAIAVSNAGVPGAEQSGYMVAAQGACAGMPRADAARVESLFVALNRAQTYPEYVRHKLVLDSIPGVGSAFSVFGIRMGPRSESEWDANDLGGEYFRNPMDVIERSPIPVLAFFGERDTQLDPVRGLQAFRAALSRAGNPMSTVVLIPGADHNMILSESGCITERQRRSVAGWRDYSPRYLDVLEEWLTTLRRRPPFTETELPPPFIRPIVKGARR